ncbi:MAG: hypothetical protein WD080_06215, partial [Egibacteraceae bacterium]
VTGPPADVAAGLVQDRAAPPPSPGAFPPPVASPPAESPPQARTVSAVGGDAAVRFHAGRVDVLWATPNAGFTADVDDDPDEAEARVEFRAPDHRSRIKAAWRRTPRRDRGAARRLIGSWVMLCHRCMRISSSGHRSQGGSASDVRP